jgi:hypothetical protein
MANPSPSITKPTWFCAHCGSTNIQHDALVSWNPETETFEVDSVLDDAWCQSCEYDSSTSGAGRPVFGIPPERSQGAQSNSAHFRPEAKGGLT